jgi:hypothetical protein
MEAPRERPSPWHAFREQLPRDPRWKGPSDAPRILAWPWIRQTVTRTEMALKARLSMPRMAVPRKPGIRGVVLLVGTALGLACAGAAAADAGDCPAPAGAPDDAWPGQQRWQRLEAAGYRLGELRIEVRDVYTGASLPWYQRLANSIHTNTEPAAVRDLLTVEAGDPVKAASIYEAERLLRGQSFLTAARIIPVACQDNRVSATVRVRDAWTLQVGASFGQAGGESSSSFAFQDENFFGTGKTVLLDWSRESERTTLEFGYEDPSLFGSDWTLELSHRELSDGSGDTVSLDYPFRRTDQRWGVRTRVVDQRVDLAFEQSGDTAYTTRLSKQQARFEVLRLVAAGPHGGWRVGAGWQRDYADYAALRAEEPALRPPPPELDDRRLGGPYVTLERFNERYKSFRNLQAIGTTEDYALGFDARFTAGRYTRGQGEPWFVGIDVEHGLALGERNLLLTRLNLSGRYREGEGPETWYRSAAVDAYHRTSERNTVVAHGEFDWRHDPDPEDELYLGGFDGLLAYPDRFRAGDRRWRVHLEDRYVSDLVLFDTIQVGYTAYVEAGNIRGLDGRWGKTLANVGAGLRLGSLRSSFGTVSYLTVAVPLVDAGDQDNYTFVVGSTVDF